ncbi:endonuclease domain-containing protein [Pseudotabrizicola alkalilacus]|uniref:Endonuclease domain-containing protein n=1 Tax=Pseudotabrizicola alkalilacus TaxID=2305252 RepID=A0A411YZK4_9RHOB|nr:endonuclease domain-containing protein [Pseudotabrizicola alkalilacus]
MSGIHPQTRTHARRLRADMTPQERKLWAKLRELNRMLGLHFRRQAPIGPFIADFSDLGRRLVIEIDGGGHGGPKDFARDQWLNAQGFTVLRVWNTEVDGNAEGVMQMVLDHIPSVPDAPPPQPSPTRGEGGAQRSGLRRADRASGASPATLSPPEGNTP